MKISEIITDKYKLRIEPTVYYDLLADVREAEEKQEPCEDATLKDIFCMGCEYKEQEPCEDVAKERYEDLCEYFGEAKDILKHREDFKAWLNRIKWHIHKAEELSEENDDLRDQLAMRDRFQKQQHCDKCVYSTSEGCQYDDITEAIPPVDPQPKTGYWIEDAGTYYKAIHERGCEPDENTPIFLDDIACSECLAKFSVIDNETERFECCPHCGAKMVEPQESEVSDDKE